MGLLTDSLISYWELEETSGTRADAFGANPLTDNNTVTSNTGKVKTAAEFTRANAEFLSHTTNADLSVGDVDHTLTAWAYLNSAVGGAGSQGVVIGSDDGTLRQWMLYWPQIEVSALFFAFRRFGVSGNAIVAASTFGAPVAATWYFLIAEYISASQLITISVNNGTADNIALGSAALSAGVEFDLGKRALVASELYWDGRVDQVGYWKRQLTPAEKAFLYNDGSGRTFGEISMNRASFGQITNWMF